jgi:hypothetical protein
VKIEKCEKMANFFDEFCFESVNEKRIHLLMDVVAKYNLRGKKFSMNIDSFQKQTVFFLNSVEGLGTIPLSVEPVLSEAISAVFYAGLIEQKLDIQVLTIVTDRSTRILKDIKKFDVIDDKIKIIEKTIHIYKDPYHLYKNFMVHVIKNKTGLNINVIKKHFEQLNDELTLNEHSYEQSHK